MFNEDGSLTLVYNGEIYNFEETRQLLLAKGHVFRTRSDTEVILHAYEEWGTQCLERFNGMFAFALWDARRQSLWVVRDRLGIKPLYYWTDGGKFACASEIKPLLRLGVVPAELNERVLDAYFSLGYVPGPETMYRGIRKLAAGHHLMVTGSGVKETQYWDFNLIPQQELSDAEAVARLQPLLHDCVQRCLVSDVPLGAFLSGGLDSSATVAMMAECGVEPINTFTVGYDGNAEESEERFAQLVAARYRTRHQVFTLEAADFFESLRILVQHAEEPIVEPAGVALFRLAQLARTEATVLLSGEGSDEVFGGYSLYRVRQRIQSLHRVLPPGLWRMLRPCGRLLPQFKHRKQLDWLAEPLERGFQGTSAHLTTSLRQGLYTPDFLATRGDYLEDTFTRLYDRLPREADALQRMLYVDTKTWLVDNLLLKADKMTMAASVELRVPFLDHRLVEFATTLPAHLKIRDSQGKWVLKESLAGRLPDAIIHRRKLGFPVPVKRWLGGGLVHLVHKRLGHGPISSWFEEAKVRTLIRRHAEGTEDHSRLLITFLVMSIFAEELSNAPKTAESP